MTEIIARRLVPGDEQMAAAIVNKCKLEEDGSQFRVDAEFMAEFLAIESNYLIAAYEGESPLGFALGYRMPRICSRKHMMYVHEVGVVSSRRREGIGKRIMRAMIQVCKQEGQLKMFLCTGMHNIPAIKLYTSVGGIPSANDDPPLGFTWEFAGNGGSGKRLVKESEQVGLEI